MSGKARKAQKDGQRRRLFDMYAANFTMYYAERYPQLVGKFICPICTKSFDRTALDEPLQVDIAHVYPRACGGKVATMTCRRCNSRIGAAYDSHLAHEDRMAKAMSGKGGAIPTRASFWGIEMGAEFAKSSDGYQIVGIKEQSHPDAAKQIREAIEKNNGVEFSLTFTGFSENRRDISLLHASYLAAFRMFGYEYIARADTHWIRNILTCEKPPEAVQLFTAQVTAHEGGDLTAERIHHRVCVVRVSEKWKMLATVFPTPYQGNTGRVICLPGFGKRGAAMYHDAMKNARNGKGKMTLTVLIDRPEERLADQKFKSYGNAIWFETFTELNEFPVAQQ